MEFGICSVKFGGVTPGLETGELLGEFSALGISRVEEICSRVGCFWLCCGWLLGVTCVGLDGFSPRESDVLVEGVSVWLSSDVAELGDPMVGFFVVPFWSMLGCWGVVVLSDGRLSVFASGWSFPGGTTLLLELAEFCGPVVVDLLCWSSPFGGGFMLVSDKPGGLSL